MNLQFGMNIFLSLCYICNEFQATSISDADRVSTLVDYIQKLLFYASLGGSPLGTGGLL